MSIEYNFAVSAPTTFNYNGEQVNTMDFPFTIEFLKTQDEEGNDTYISFNQLEASSNYEFVRSEDGTQVIVYVYLDMNEVDENGLNEFERFIGFLQLHGLEWVKGDFERTGDNLVWVMGIGQSTKYRAVNPKFKQSALADEVEA